MLEDELFRRQAVENSHDRLTGNVFLFLELSTNILFVTITLIVIISLFFFSKFSFSENVFVQGILVNTRNSYKVFIKKEGFLNTLAVKEGDKVRPGDLLIKIDSVIESVNGDSNHLLIIKELKEQFKIQERLKKESLEADINTIKSLELEIIIEKEKKTNLEFDKGLIYQRKDIIVDTLDKKKQMKDVGGISENDLNETKSDLLTLESEIKSIEFDLYLSQKKIVQLQLKHRITETVSRKNILNIENALSILRKKIIELKTNASHLIESPTTGYVTNVIVTEGEYISSNWPVMTITPEDSKLMAEIFVPSRSIGFIALNQSIFMQLDAYPYHTYGHVKGKIIEISKDLLLPNEWKNPLNILFPVYRIKVELENNYILAKGNKVYLRNGIKFSASIILDNKTVLEHLMTPFYEIKNKKY